MLAQLHHPSRWELAVRAGWVVLGMVFLYVIWVLAARDLAAPLIRKAPPGIAPFLLGTDPRILHFYSNSAWIYRGESAVLCYGVLNVRSVRIDPPVQPINVSWNKCIAASPSATTKYNLVAETADGKQLVAGFTVMVKPPKPEFLFVDASAKQIVRGDRWSMCYGVKNAVKVTFVPAPMPTPPAQKHCIMMFPATDTEFNLTIFGEGGDTDSIKIPLKVVAKAPKK